MTKLLKRLWTALKNEVTPPERRTIDHESLERLSARKRNPQ